MSSRQGIIIIAVIPSLLCQPYRHFHLPGHENGPFRSAQASSHSIPLDPSICGMDTCPSSWRRDIDLVHPAAEPGRRERREKEKGQGKKGGPLEAQIDTNLESAP